MGRVESFDFMKPFLTLILSTLTLLADSPRLDNVHAIWSGGSIIISWPDSGPGVYQVRRLVNGHREITFTLSDTQLAHLVDGRLSYTDSVAINVGEISYQVRKRGDTGNKGVWSKPAVEENKPSPSTQDLMKAKEKEGVPSQPPIPPL